MNSGRRLLALGVISPCFAGCVLGQGQVNLNNNFTPPGGTAKAYIFNMDGQLLPKAFGRVEILDSNWRVIRSGGLALDGIFAFGVMEIPGSMPGGNASIIICSWDVRTGASFGAATDSAYSMVTLNGLGGGSIPPPSLALAGNFTGLRCCVLSPADPPSDVGIAFGTDDSMTIQCTGWEWYPYMLWSSADLLHWIPAGEFQIPGFGEVTNQWYRIARWQVPKPSSTLFFRVAPHLRPPISSVAP